MCATDSHVQVYRSIWHKTHYNVTDKNNNVNSEDIDKHYHKYTSLSYQNRWDISNNVCLNHSKLLLFYISLMVKFKYLYTEFMKMENGH